MAGQPKRSVVTTQGNRMRHQWPARSADADGVRTERVVFQSGGERVVGDLYLPEAADGSRGPGVVVAGAWATVKEQMAGGYAREMAARGYVALAFNFRTWGQSGGQPRSMEDPCAKADDIVAAAEFLTQYDAVNPEAIAALGICAGSNYLVGAAITAPLLTTVAFIAPALPTRADLLDNLGGEQNAAALVDAANEALDEFERSGRQALVPAVPAAGDDHAALHFARTMESAPR